MGFNFCRSDYEKPRWMIRGWTSWGHPIPPYVGVTKKEVLEKAVEGQPYRTRAELRSSIEPYRDLYSKTA